MECVMPTWTFFSALHMILLLVENEKIPVCILLDWIRFADQFQLNVLSKVHVEFIKVQHWSERCWSAFLSYSSQLVAAINCWKLRMAFSHSYQIGDNNCWRQFSSLIFSRGPYCMACLTLKSALKSALLNLWYWWALLISRIYRSSLHSMKGQFWCADILIFLFLSL